MTHAFWDQPGPLGGTFQEGSLWPLCPVQLSSTQLLPTASPGSRKRLSVPAGKGSLTGLGHLFSWMVNCPVCFWQHDQYSHLSTRTPAPLPYLHPGLPGQCTPSWDVGPLTTVLPCKRLIRDMVGSLVWEGLLEEGMTTHSIILA